MEFVEVSERLGEPALRGILSASVGFPTPEKLARVAEDYASKATWIAFALTEGADVLGVIGVEIDSPGRARISHIAVDPIRRRRGLGRTLVERVIREWSLTELSAETDGDAVEFYRRCGFTVQRLPGHDEPERFSCRAKLSDGHFLGPSSTRQIWHDR